MNCRRSWPLAIGVKLVVALLLAVGLAACLSSVATLPDRILDPDVVGVVTDQSQGSMPSSRVYDVGDGTVELELGSDMELTGPGPAEDRMLIVAREGDETFYISLVPAESMTIDVDCYRLSGTTAWKTSDGIVFEFPPAEVGIRLPAAPDYDPRIDAETGFIRSDQSFCLTPDGVVHDPGG